MMFCSRSERGLTKRKEKAMILYSPGYGGYSEPVRGPYDDPDWVAYCTCKERYAEDDSEDTYEPPFAVYDP